VRTCTCTAANSSELFSGRFEQSHPDLRLHFPENRVWRRRPTGASRSAMAGLSPIARPLRPSLRLLRRYRSLSRSPFTMRCRLTRTAVGHQHPTSWRHWAQKTNSLDGTTVARLGHDPVKGCNAAGRHMLANGLALISPSTLCSANRSIVATPSSRMDFHGFPAQLGLPQ